MVRHNVLVAFGLMLIVSASDVLGMDSVESNSGEVLHSFIERVSMLERSSDCGFISRTNNRFRIRIVECSAAIGEHNFIVYQQSGWQRLEFDAVPANVSLSGGVVAGKILAEFSASSGLTKDEFASSLSVPLAHYTKQTQHEACAQICKSSAGEWGATITTVGSHVMCPITGACPSGMTPTGEGIHSHPTGGSYNINDADKAVLLSGPFYRLGAKELRGKTDVFSREDFKAGPGYMVTDKGRLMHQDGPKKVRVISIGM